GRDPGEIERRGAEAAQAGDLLLNGGSLLLAEREIAASEVRQPAGDDGFVELRAGSDPDALLVQERTFAALGEKRVVVGRIVDEAGDDRAFALERNRNGEVRNAVQEIGGAVERIDDPCVRSVGAFAAAAFLAEKAVAGARFDQFLIERFFRAPVGGGNEIRGALERDLQLFQFAEIALERARSL